MRWLRTATTIHSVYIKQDNLQDYIWRRIQVSDAQAERQKKSILQLSLTFHSRAETILKDDGSIHQLRGNNNPVCSKLVSCTLNIPDRSQWARTGEAWPPSFWRSWISRSLGPGNRGVQCIWISKAICEGPS